MARKHGSKPMRGMTVAFKETASHSLAGIPATVVDIWPQFRSGEYLVTLEYAAPVKFRKTVLRHIDAFISELDMIEDVEPSFPTPRTRGGWLSTSLKAG